MIEVLHFRSEGEFTLPYVLRCDDELVFRGADKWLDVSYHIGSVRVFIDIPFFLKLASFPADDTKIADLHNCQ